MLIRIIVLAVLAVFNIIFFKDIENYFLGIGTSWTFSKILPYFILLLIGAYLSFTFFKKEWIKNKMLLNIVTVLIFALPFGLGFTMHPIYQGDFSNGGTNPNIKEQPAEFNQADLVVLTIPGCPFCHESVISANLMVKRNPDLKITYVVCSTDAKETEPYRRKLDQKIAVVTANKPDEMAKIAEGRFPTFLQLKNEKITLRWSNNEFGVRAKDALESKD